MNTYATNNAVEESEKINRKRIQERKSTSEELQKAGLVSEARSLIIENYQLSARKPKINPKRYLADQLVKVYDKDGICVGEIKNQKFYWVREYRNACKNLPTGETE